MPELKTIEDLKCFREEAYRSIKSRDEMTTRIIVGMGTCGIAAGAGEVLRAILDELTRRDVEAEVTTVGCIGMCSKEPLVDIVKPGRPRISYESVTPQTALELIDDYVVGDDPRPGLALAVIGDNSYDGIPAWGELPFLARNGALSCTTAASLTRRALRSTLPATDTLPWVKSSPR